MIGVSFFLFSFAKKQSDNAMKTKKIANQTSYEVSINDYSTAVITVYICKAVGVPLKTVSIPMNRSP